MIIGRLTKDLELRYTQSGTAVSQFTIAVDRPFKKQNGERETDFIRCVAWDKKATTIATYTRKGDQIAVAGPIETGYYDAPAGHRVYTTEINVSDFKFLEPKKQEANTEDPFSNLSSQEVGALNNQFSNELGEIYQEKFESASSGNNQTDNSMSVPRIDKGIQNSPFYKELWEKYSDELKDVRNENNKESEPIEFTEDDLPF